jgi:hypothetical protein
LAGRERPSDVPEPASIASDLPGARRSHIQAPACPGRKAEQAPIIRHISGSKGGGWQLFCRLLLWVTRNSRDGKAEA